jgi:hypothetical protein
MYYYVYKTTNLINKKFYYGVHKSKTYFDSKYLGSGVLLKKAIALYGQESFEVEVIQYFDTYENALKFEKDIITPEFILSESCYNLNIGGAGGSFSGHVKNFNRNPVSEETRKKISKTLTGKSYLTEAGRKQLSEASKGNSYMKGKTFKHTEDAKKRISKNRSGIPVPNELRIKMGQARKGKGVGNNNGMADPINRKKVSDSKIGLKKLTHAEIKGYKLARQDSAKWNELILLGYMFVG